MQQTTVNNVQELTAFVQAIDERYEEEKKILCMAVMSLISTSGTASRKDVLLYLIAELEKTQDVVRLDILRNCLELVTRPADYQGF